MACKVMAELGMVEEGEKEAKHAEDEGDFGVKNVKKGKRKEDAVNAF